MNAFDYHFRTLAADWLQSSTSAWWERAAGHAIKHGAFRVIPNRDRSHPYLLRCWLTPTVAVPGENDPESGDSVLLHHFLQPDDDGALHDHPWCFSTLILSGGYDEALPPIGWNGANGGPPIGDRIVKRRAGDRIEHAATDVHAVARIEPGTWTMVSTGRRERPWFFHPPGEQPVLWREFIAQKQVMA